MLGNAAGTAARAYERFYPGAEVDGVELDPAVSDAGRRYFGMGEIGTLSVHDADARAFLRRTDQTYDVIIVDAYRPPYVPFYLATEEFFELVRARLRPGGIVRAQRGDDAREPRPCEEHGGMLASVLPRAYAWQPLKFNQIVIGQNGEPTGSVRVAPPRSRLSSRISGHHAPDSSRRATRGRTIARRSSGSPTG